MGPFFPYFLSYLCGILIGFPESRDFIFPFFLPIVCILISAFLLKLSTKLFSYRTLILICLTGFGYWNAVVLEPKNLKAPLEDIIEEANYAQIKGNITQIIHTQESPFRFIMEITEIRYDRTWISTEGNARINIYYKHPHFQFGDRILISKIRLKRPRNFKNPGQFDYRRYLSSRGISFIGSVSKLNRIEKIGNFVPSFLNKTRQNLIELIINSTQKSLPPREFGLLIAMTLGDKSFLEKGIKENFIRTGLSHLMAVSGLHIGFVAFSFFYIVKKISIKVSVRYFLNLARSGAIPIIAAVLALVPTFLYLFVVGQKISALRAGFLAGLFFFAILAGRKNQILHALILAAFFILLWSPQSILDIGFQLSFSGVLVILAAYKLAFDPPKDAIDKMLEEPEWKKRLKTWTWVSSAAYFGTFPFIVFHFHSISLTGLILNILLVPLAGLFIPFAIAIISINFFIPYFLELFTLPISWFLKFFILITEYFSKWQYSAVLAPKPPEIWFVIYPLALFGSLYGVYLFQRRHSKNQKETVERRLRAFLPFSAMMTVCVIFWIVWPRLPSLNSNQLRISVLDVAQGESIFIEFPNGKNLLVDGGGFYKNSLDIGRTVVAPFILNRGYGSIDYLLATHSDQDHISGLESIVGYLDVQNFLFSTMLSEDLRIKKLAENAKLAGAEISQISPGSILKIGDVSLNFLHPDGSFIKSLKKGRYKNRNNQSLVFRLDYGSFSALLTGDIESEAENYLVENKAHLSTTILKLPHHGSKSSSTSKFLKAVQPKAVLVSSGYLNRFGHPHPNILTRVQNNGSEIWRTDLNGALTVTTDGKAYEIKSFENN
jgi:competence protein ComEC